MKIKEGGGMDIQSFIAEFKKTFVYDLLSMTLRDEQLFEHVVDGDSVLWFKEQTRQMWLMWEKAQAQAQAVPKGFVLISAEQLSQWGHMANYAEQYGCPECFEARGYAHSLACEINEFFAIELQEPAK